MALNLPLVNTAIAASGIKPLGGDVVGILLRQGIRINAILKNKLRQRSLLIQNQAIIQNPVSFIGDAIPITVLQQEAWNYEADVTTYPIESGAIVSDHVILRPLRVDLTFEVSNWDKTDGPYTMEIIDALWKTRSPMELITTFKKIPNMVIINFHATNAVPDWGKLSGRISFQQIGIAKISSEVYTRDTVTPTEKTGGEDVTESAVPEENLGTKSTKSAFFGLLWGTKK